MSDKHTRTIKQVIILRSDLRNEKGEKCRTGKLCSQASHASMAFLTKNGYIFPNDSKYGCFHNEKLKNPEEINLWLEEGFTKVCLKCDSEAELMTLHSKALEAGLNSELIIDSGFTEFNGVATATAIGIGPNKSEDIDKITGHLKLL